MYRIAFMLGITIFSAPSANAAFPDPKDLPKQVDFPDPLLFFNGKKVTTKSEWVEQRRPELKALFQHYMYGMLPPAPKDVPAKVLHEDPKAFGGKATVREVALTVLGDHSLRLLIALPNQRKGPVGVFVGPNFCGNHCLVADPNIAIPTSWMYPKYPGVKDNRATAEGRGKQSDVWNIEQTIDRGYAVATFYNGDVDPDDTKVRGGIRPLLPKDLATTTIACWAWGVHRCVDHLLTLKEIDAKRVIAVGHSRLGKTALLAAAFDERIALAIPHQAGCGGTAPSRGKIGESVARINTSFPHWFNEQFKQFNDDPTRLPFDQHCLVALCAPRPVLFSNAQKDQWANPDGQFAVLQAATPVYRFLGVDGLEAKEVPPLSKLVPSRLGYFIRAGEHSMNKEDWQAFLDFADAQLGKP